MHLFQDGKNHHEDLSKLGQGNAKLQQNRVFKGGLEFTCIVPPVYMKQNGLRVFKVS